MILNLTFKTPDVIDQLELAEQGAMQEWLKKHVEYGECLYVEVDTDTGESKILEV
jgi:hypothetical protein